MQASIDDFKALRDVVSRAANANREAIKSVCTAISCSNGTLKKALMPKPQKKELPQ